MPTYTNPKNDRRTITHTGSELGSGNVTLNQNATGREDTILSWTCPRKYDQITYAAGRHYTKFIPRYKEVFSGDGGTTTFTLTGTVDPPHGETVMEDQNYPPVVAYDTDAGTELDVESVDYATGDVTLATAPNNANDNLLLWPVLVEGTVKFIGEDQFGHRIAALDPWGIPIHSFNDYNQSKNMTQVHLTGAVSWEESEKLGLYLESPRQVVWSDADYPRGQYASTIQQEVDVDV